MNYRRVTAISKRVLLSGIAAIMVVMYPANVFASDTTTSAAETSTTTSSETTPAPEPAPTTTSTNEPAPTPAASSTSEPEPEPAPTAPANEQGPTSPSGADSDTYTYNSATGMWENERYSWDPQTGQTKPKEAPTYSYNPKTGMWDTTEWKYNPASGRYEPNTVSVANNPQAARSAALSAPGTQVTGTNTSDTTFNLFYNTAISNSITSQATSGNALVSGNTLAGSATSGDALSVANVFNLLQSTMGGNGQNIATFSADILGDVFGDLYINPDALASAQPAGNVTTTDTRNLTVNATNDSTITNNVDLSARSGNATVDHNTEAGDAKTGDAHVIANLVNMLNSSISSGDSFLAMLNIYGNLNGDILLPPSLREQLIAHNAPGTNVTRSATVTEDIDVTLNNNQLITNNVNATAGSGNATVDHNTEAGDATTGKTSNSLTILNLTGQNVVSKNSLLVFVNVLGDWVGLIMNAPRGTTAAALGGDVSPNSTTSLHADIDVTNNERIDNNLNLAAQSGNARVNDNTAGGNAKSGDATTSANIANITNSNFALSDWFGVLFINVFGSWRGSFGVDTAAGERPAQTGGKGAGVGSGQEATSTQAGVFRFASAQFSSTASSNNFDQQVSGQQHSSLATAGQTSRATTPTTATQTKANPASAQSVPVRRNYLIPTIGVIIGLILFGIERYLTFRKP